MRAADWVLEAVFSVTWDGVVGAAGEIGVFACGERGWDGDYGDGGGVDVNAFVRALGEG